MSYGDIDGHCPECGRSDELQSQLVASEEARKKAEAENKRLTLELCYLQQRAEAAEQCIKESQEQEPFAYWYEYETDLTGDKQDNCPFISAKLYKHPIIPPELSEVIAERDDLKRQVLRVVRGEFNQICSYCGWEAKKPANWEQLQAHINECPEHPVGKLKRENIELRTRLNGQTCFVPPEFQKELDAVKAENAELQRRIAELEKDARRYQELLYTVERKFPNESRHDTALRYIKNAEKSVLQPASAAIAKEQSK